MDILILLSFVIYFCILTAIGFVVSKKETSSQDFLLGGRSINYWVTAIATQASDMGSYLFLALPATIYVAGLNAAWAPIGLVVGMYLTWKYIAPALRIQTEHYQSLTLSSFLESRFNDTSGAIRLISAAMTILFFTFYIASGLVGLGRLFEIAFGLSYHQGIIVGLLSAAIYTLIGGFVAVAWCDFFQGMFLFFMILLVPTAAYFSLGSWAPITHALYAKGLDYQLAHSWSEAFRNLLLALGWGLGYFGQPHILTNFMGIDNVANMYRAQRVGMTWQIIVLSAAVAIGFIGMGYFPNGLINNELIFILMAKDLLYPLIAGFALCGILAATLSTMDSHILISGSVLAEDVYKQFINQKASSQKIISISRIAAISISALSLWVASNDSNTVYGLVNYAWSGLGSSFGPIIIFALHSTIPTRAGALAGILIGGIVSALWPYELPLVPGFIFSCIAILSVSSITEK